MKEWPQIWRADRYLMERACPHGIGHPDPDDPKTVKWYERVHGCDGCCEGSYEGSHFEQRNDTLD